VPRLRPPLLAAVLPALVAVWLLWVDWRDARRTAGAADPGAPATVVRLLDVGQGDATYIHNGPSRVIVDGGPDAVRLGALLDSLGVRDDTVDLVVLTHAHLDHYAGLTALFETDRHLVIRSFMENGDAASSPAPLLDALRDSVFARVDRDGLHYTDSDDPCGDGRRQCVIPLRGGAHLDVLAPLSMPATQNDRSVALKLVGADSTGFTMWLAGDAEHPALAGFDLEGDAAVPGMRANILKADHHGSCNGVTPRYLALVRPDTVLVSVGAGNDYGHMHEQAKGAYRAAGVPWYRTDRNGTITVHASGTPGSSYRVTPSRAGISLNGPSDRLSRQLECAAM